MRIMKGACPNIKAFVSSRILTQTQHLRPFMTDTNRRSAAIQTLFQLVESKYGNLPSLIDKGKPAETIVSGDGRIHPHHLIRLFKHEATAYHIPNFYNSESAKILGDKLIQESRRSGGDNWKVSTSRGLESSDVATLGKHPPYNVAMARAQNNSSTTLDDEYFDGVLQEFQSRRRREENAANYYQLWPLDKLRLELEECWPSGAGLARECTTQHQNDSHPRPFGGGLPRIMRGPTRWKRGFIHVDEMSPLNATKGLFSANIYLSMPSIENKSDEDMDGADDDVDAHKRDSGGLYIWPLGVRSRLDWYRNAITLSSLSAQDPETQMKLQHVFGKPNIIRPKSGDLVLLCAQRVSIYACIAIFNVYRNLTLFILRGQPHCAVGFNDGFRVSLQCFLQYNGLDKRLLIDC